MKYNNIYIAVIIALMTLSACSHSHDDHDHSDEQMSEDAHDDHEEEELALTPEQIKNVNLQYGRIQNRNIVSTVQINGRIELPPEGRAKVSAAIGGQIKQVHVIPGQRISKGQRLFSLSNLDILDWYQESNEIKARIKYLDQEKTRLETLAQENLTSTAKINSIIAEKDQLAARQNGIMSKLSAIGLSAIDEGTMASDMYTVRSPINGVIQHLPVSLGSFVDATTTLAEIINDHHLHIHLQAFGTELDKLQKGQKLNFYVPSRPDDIRTAEIIWINNLANLNSNSYDVHAEIVGESKGLYSGEYVEARIIDENALVPSLPLSAVTTDKGLNYIFIIGEEHEGEIHFEKIQVSTGVADLGYVEVQPIDPIPQDKDIVIENAYFLMAQSKKSEEGAGHEH